MNVLICGVAGFIGSHLADANILAGNKVFGVDNLSTGSIENIKHLMNNPNFIFYQADICTWEPCIHINIALIYQFASPASPVAYKTNPIETYNVNSWGNYRMLEYAKKCNARFVFASTSEVYGDPLVHPQVESYYGNVNSIGIRSCYDESKRFGEGMTIEYNRQYGLDTRVLRIFNVYGKRMLPDDGRVVSNFIKQALENNPITIYGDGSQTRSFCYVSDMIAGIIKLGTIDGLQGKVVNLGNPAENTITELADKVICLTKSDSKKIFLPLTQDDPLRRKPNIDKAKKLLNWEPTVTLNEGLKLLLDLSS